MPRYLKYLFFIFSIFIVFILYQMYDKTATTMKYFPIDQNNSISDAKTELEYDTEQKSINWMVTSTSNQPVYLRQDVSLLYANGVFKGVQNKWDTNSEKLEQKQTIPFTQDTLLQSISFHHGELHNDDITSIQEMTGASLYIIKEDDNSFAFQKPKTTNEDKIAKKLANQTNDLLQNQLDNLLTYYDINPDNYTIIPLVELGNLNKDFFFSNSDDINPKVLGQFWEGFYSQYMTLLMSYDKEIPRHFMPIILIAKDESHLLVLYELEQEKYKLIQQISPN